MISSTATTVAVIAAVSVGPDATIRATRAGGTAHRRTGAPRASDGSAASASGLDAGAGFSALPQAA
ncbi:MAG: hypothetical protein ABSG43_18465 [Solirubrobacteraceae bacterium]